MVLDRTPGKGGDEARAAPRVRREGGERRSERRASLEAQRRALAAQCKRSGWQLLEALEPAGRSAKDLQAGIQDTQRVRERADAQALVAAKRDLPSRVLADLASLLASAQKRGFALVALDCSLETTTTPAREAMMGVLVRFAPLERGLHSQRIRRALAAKRAQGVRLGRPPTMSPYALERIRRERAAGKSLAAIANGLNADRIPTAQGGARWYPATVRYTLKRSS